MDARAAMDALGDAIVVIAPDWSVCYLNAPWERILGVSRRDALQHDFWTVYPGFCVEPYQDMIRSTAEDGKVRRFDLGYVIAGELRSYGVRVARDTSNNAVLVLSRSFEMMKNARERALEERNQENAALRALARQTAAVSD
ncbi:MAG TPA: PAS domain-containing protein, partial [Gemmatimonadaceae bacterium]|nr:PAS domain-containing protein [Gemmatimonadaceae bacterium]